MEVEGKGDYNLYIYTYRYTVATRMTPAWWAAIRAILMFHNCEGQSHKTASTDYNKRKENQSRFEPSLTAYY